MAISLYIVILVRTATFSTASIAISSSTRYCFIIITMSNTPRRVADWLKPHPIAVVICIALSHLNSGYHHGVYSPPIPHSPPSRFMYYYDNNWDMHRRIQPERGTRTERVNEIANSGGGQSGPQIVVHLFLNRTFSPPTDPPTHSPHIYILKPPMYHRLE